MYRKIIFYLIIILLMFFLGCQEQPKVTFEGIGTRFSSAAKPPGENDPNSMLVYNIKPGEPFKGYFQLYNQRQTDKYYVTALFDYKQIPFKLDGKKSKIHEIFAKDGENAWSPLETEPLIKGFHDFAMIIFWNTDKQNMNLRYRVNTLTYMNYNRSNFIVGNEAPPKNTFTDVNNIKNTSISSFNINQSRNSKDFQSKILASKGKKINYFLHLGNEGKKEKTYTVIPFLSYKQIPLNPNDSLVKYFKVKPHSSISYKATLVAPHDKGINELVVLAISNPFKKLKNEQDAIIESSMRIQLKVID